MKYINNFNKFKLNEELDFKMSPTDYEIIKTNPLFISGNKDDIYRFITKKNNNSYDLYFSLTYESDYTLSNGNNIKNITRSFIPTIFFSLTERGLDVSTFDKLTDEEEKFEVMSKIFFLINEYDKIHNYKLYSIGEVDKKKYKFYSYYLYNIPQFKIVEGGSDNYNGNKCYYLIK
jgi:hypothetical protein